MHNRISLPKRKNQQGISLLIVVFALVVLGALGAAMANLMSAGSESVAREVISMRALLAAQSGADRKLNDLFEGSGICDPLSPDDYPFTPITNLSCDSVRVTCDFIESPTGSGNLFYTITSTGRCGPTGDRAVRTVQVQAR